MNEVRFSGWRLSIQGFKNEPWDLNLDSKTAYELEQYKQLLHLLCIALMRFENNNQQSRPQRYLQRPVHEV